jgi:hypothetical protein
VFASLVRWFGRGATRTVGRWLAGSPREPSAEDDKGAGI